MPGAHKETGRQLADAGEHHIGGLGHIAQVGYIEIQLLGPQMLGQVRGVVHLHAGVDAGKTHTQRLQQARHHGGRRIRPHPQRDVANLALAVQADIALQAAAVKHQLARTLHHKSTGIGAGHVHRTPVKQLQAQFVLRRLDAAAERRLAEMALQGRAPKVARVRQSHQVFESFQVHGRLRSFPTMHPVH